MLNWLKVVLVVVFATATAVDAEAQHADGFDQAYLNFLFGSTTAATGPTSTLPAQSADRSTRERVRLDVADAAGTILIDTASRRLYLVEGNGSALRYVVGVGAEGFGWRGTESVTAKRTWPDWRPPASMRARRPELPTFMPGGPDNPMGARALYLGNTLYRIHGSNEPTTVGHAASSGCFRMTNTDIIDLYERTSVGARVRVF